MCHSHVKRQKQAKDAYIKSGPATHVHTSSKTSNSVKKTGARKTVVGRTKSVQNIIGTGVSLLDTQKNSEGPDTAPPSIVREKYEMWEGAYRHER